MSLTGDLKRILGNGHKTTDEKNGEHADSQRTSCFWDLKERGTVCSVGEY